jgi:hypothetical protein
MIHRRDFVGVTRDLSTYRVGPRQPIGPLVYARRWVIQGCVPHSFIAKQLYALLEVWHREPRRQEILLPMR